MTTPEAKEALDRMCARILSRHYEASRIAPWWRPTAEPRATVRVVSAKVIERWLRGQPKRGESGPSPVRGRRSRQLRGDRPRNVMRAMARAGEIAPTSSSAAPLRIELTRRSDSLQAALRLLGLAAALPSRR